jgi:hypothetical protein
MIEVVEMPGQKLVKKIQKKKCVHEHSVLLKRNHRPLRQCPGHAFQIDYFGDNLQTCQEKSAATQVHDWVVYRLGGILGSVVHRVKIHNITPVTGKERVTWKTGLRRLAKTPRLDRLPSSSAYTHIRFYFDAYAFWKITDVFSWTADAHQADGWCPRV